MFACPACGQSNPTDSRFCGACGSALEGEKASGLIGSTIANRYRVLRVIAEGGMGVVYEAAQPMGEGSRKVAIKMLLPELSHDHLVVSRFTRECAVVASLEHPNIVRVYDFGHTDDGSLYIAMEYVKGQSLGDVLAQGKLSISRTLGIIEQISMALEEAHEKGIVHRDLKPDNIVLTSSAGISDFVKLLDFGIAKRSSEGGKHDTKLTQQGMVLGTPPYMSPEQFTSEPLDHLTDIYALAVIVYEMLNGRLPFDADTPWQWAHHHLSQEPRPFVTPVPKSVEQVVFSGLSKLRHLRPPTAREFYQKLAHAAGSALAQERASVGAGGIVLPTVAQSAAQTPVATGGRPQVIRTEPSRVVDDIPFVKTPFDGGLSKPERTAQGASARGVTEPSMAPLAAMVGPATAPSALALSRAGQGATPFVSNAFPPARPLVRKRAKHTGLVFGLLGVSLLLGTAIAAVLFWQKTEVLAPPLPATWPTLSTGDSQPPVEIRSETNVKPPTAISPPTYAPRVTEVHPTRSHATSSGGAGPTSAGQAAGAPPRVTDTPSTTPTVSPPQNATSPASPFPIQLPFPIPSQLFPPSLPVPQSPSPQNTVTAPPNTPAPSQPNNAGSPQGSAACVQATALASTNLRASVDQFLICRSTADAATVQSTRIAVANAGRSQAVALARRGQCAEARQTIAELERMGAQRPAEIAVRATGACGN